MTRAVEEESLHGESHLREAPLTGAVQEESQLQEQASKLEAGSAKANRMKVRSEFLKQFRKQPLALWAACSGPVPSFRAQVCLVRQYPLTGAVQKESQLQEQASKLEAGSAERQTEERIEASF